NKKVANRRPFCFGKGIESGGFEGGAVVNDVPVARQSRDETEPAGENKSFRPCITKRPMLSHWSLFILPRKVFGVPRNFFQKVSKQVPRTASLVTLSC
ncbi:MAG: hypothetical protein IIX30_00740, partial [Clostridia bacterium]|nr:hypothetical protein [Clostridia bacterium]